MPQRRRPKTATTEIRPVAISAPRMSAIASVGGSPLPMVPVSGNALAALVLVFAIGRTTSERTSDAGVGLGVGVGVGVGGGSHKGPVTAPKSVAAPVLRPAVTWVIGKGWSKVKVKSPEVKSLSMSSHFTPVRPVLPGSLVTRKEGSGAESTYASKACGQSESTQKLRSQRRPLEEVTV